MSHEGPTAADQLKALPGGRVMAVPTEIRHSHADERSGRGATCDGQTRCD